MWQPRQREAVCQKIPCVALPTSEFICDIVFLLLVLQRRRKRDVWRRSSGASCDFPVLPARLVSYITYGKIPFPNSACQGQFGRTVSMRLPPIPIGRAVHRHCDSLIRSSILALNSVLPEHMCGQVNQAS